ncbi:Uncharacterised protein [Mycobacteroides abscessus subsp. abscessus]|nr:Uncharacterised protein [Mycobacteroides abscessus subsp. abscessus]
MRVHRGNGLRQGIRRLSGGGGERRCCGGVFPAQCAGELADRRRGTGIWTARDHSPGDETTGTDEDYAGNKSYPPQAILHSPILHFSHTSNTINLLAVGTRTSHDLVSAPVNLTVGRAIGGVGQGLRGGRVDEFLAVGIVVSRTGVDEEV